MIFIMSKKYWDKYKKKLVEYKNYMILDGTDDDNAKMSQFTNTVTMDAFCPPSRLLKLVSDDGFNDDDIIDLDKIEELENRFFEGASLNNAVLATVSGLLESDINMFIVLRNSAFKHYGKKLRKRFITVFDPGFSFVFILKDKVKEYKDSLEKSLSDKEKEILGEKLHKLEKEMEKRFEKRKAQKRRKK